VRTVDTRLTKSERKLLALYIFVEVSWKNWKVMLDIKSTFFIHGMMFVMFVMFLSTVFVMMFLFTMFSVCIFLSDSKKTALST